MDVIGAGIAVGVLAGAGLLAHRLKGAGRTRWARCNAGWICWARALRCDRCCPGRGGRSVAWRGGSTKSCRDFRSGSPNWNRIASNSAPCSAAWPRESSPSTAAAGCLFANASADRLFGLGSGSVGRLVPELIRSPQVQEAVEATLAGSRPYQGEIILGEPRRRAARPAARSSPSTARRCRVRRRTVRSWCFTT